MSLPSIMLTESTYGDASLSIVIDSIPRRISWSFNTRLIFSSKKISEEYSTPMADITSLFSSKPRLDPSNKIPLVKEFIRSNSDGFKELPQ